MKIKIILPPEKEPLTLEETKKHLKIDSNINDDILPSLIKQAREWCEWQQGKKYVTQTLEGYLDFFPNGSIEFIDCSPVQSVTCIKYIGADDKEYTVDSSYYELDNVSFVNKIDLKYGKVWPSTKLKTSNGVIIRFVAGYEPDGENLTANIPETVKQAMILQMKLLFEAFNADEQKRIERARDILLGIDRVIPA